MAPRKHEGSDGQGEGRGHSSKSKSKGPSVPKDSEDYKKRRERNNIAVRKSRQLSRQKAKVMSEKVTQLRAENKGLEEKVQLLSKELEVLKDFFLSTVVPNTGGEAGISPKEEEVLSGVKSLITDHKYSAEAWEENS